MASNSTVSDDLPKFDASRSRSPDPQPPRSERKERCARASRRKTSLRWRRIWKNCSPWTSLYLNRVAAGPQQLERPHTGDERLLGLHRKQAYAERGKSQHGYQPQRMQVAGCNPPLRYRLVYTECELARRSPTSAIKEHHQDSTEVPAFNKGAEVRLRRGKGRDSYQLAVVQETAHHQPTRSDRAPGNQRISNRWEDGTPTETYRTQHGILSSNMGD